MKSFFNLIKLVITIIILFYAFKIVAPYLPEIIRSFKYQSMQDLTRMNSIKEKELFTVQPPVFDISEITDILEMATEKQNITVTIDTIVDVTKTYKSAVLELAGYNKPVFTQQSKARTKRLYSFEIKAGYNFKQSRIKPSNQYVLDTLYVYLPHAQILSVESNIDQFKEIVDEDKKRYELYANSNYITVDQSNDIYESAKKLSIKKAISENILTVSEYLGMKSIQNYLIRINPNVKIKIEVN